MELKVIVLAKLDPAPVESVVRDAFRALQATEGKPKRALTVRVAMRAKRSHWTWRLGHGVLTITLNSKDPQRGYLNRAAYTGIAFAAYDIRTARTHAFKMKVPLCERPDDRLPTVEAVMKPVEPIQVRRARVAQARVLRLENEIDKLTGMLVSKRRSLAAAEKKLRYYEKVLGGEPRPADSDNVFAEKMRRKRTADA